ncbi:ribonuclease H2, subunit B [Tuber borchii]|uniref:Ribonuclease H2 subunit B n=1 Tax=Tuber borchii TaxID=42251 RepID=A0A2T6ZKB8_TUBBO|nr:ribonuclease H2, subunit B [Tuber borchii]
MSTTKPPHIVLLPSTLPSTDLKIITLPHPRTLVPTRYLVHPTQGLHEITKLAAPASIPRSWLLTPSEPSSPPKWLGNGQILQDGSMYICTPMDPLFVLLPRLFPADAADAINRFLPMEDLFEEITKEEEEGDWGLVVGSQVTEKRLAAVCESVDVGDERAYKPSREKLMRVLDGKCVRMAKGGLPATMEEEFVQKPLTRPMAEIMAEETERKKGAESVKELEVRSIKKQEDNDGERGGSDGEAAAEGAGALFTPPDSQAARPRLAEASQEVTDLLRIRVASEFISNNYLSISIAEVLSDRLQKSHDFTPLDSYLSELIKSRQEATAMRSDDFTLKRSYQDEEGIVDRKRKKKEAEEAEKKKKSVSRATKELQKADTRGMAKMTTYFTRKAA